MNKDRVILIVMGVKLSGEKLGELKNKNTNPDHFMSLLPRYCLRKDTGYVDYTDHYLQWVEDGREEYVMFDVVGADTILQFEIDNGGLEETLRGFDLRNIFEHIDVCTNNNFRMIVPPSGHIVLDFIHHGDYDDYELEVKLVGYLDNDRMLKII